MLLDLDRSLVTVVYLCAKTFVCFPRLPERVVSRAIMFPKAYRESYRIIFGGYRYSMSFIISYRQNRKSRDFGFSTKGFSFSTFCFVACIDTGCNNMDWVPYVMRNQELEKVLQINTIISQDRK